MFTSDSSGKHITAFSAVILLTITTLIGGQLIASPTQTPAPSPYPAQFLGFAEPNPGLIPPQVMPSLFGPKRARSEGDVYSAVLNNPDWTERYGQYTYHIEIPSAESYDTIRVELFDPDTYNQKYGAGDTAASAQPVYRTDGTYTPKYCPDPSNRPWNSCVVTTRANSYDPPQPNDSWFFRVDEIRWTASGALACGYNPVSCPNGLWYDTWEMFYPAKLPTDTMFRLYYLRSHEDGVTTEVDLAYYIAKGADTHTDLMWITPGAPTEYRMPAFDGTSKQCVFAELGIASQGDLCSPAEPVTSTEDCVDYRSAHYGPNTNNTSVDYRYFTQAMECSGDGDFLVNMQTEVPDIVTDQDGKLRLYVDVRTLTNYSENGFMIAARGLGADVPEDRLPAQVNARQTYIIAREQQGQPTNPSGRLTVMAHPYNSLNSLKTSQRDNPSTPSLEANIPTSIPLTRLTASDAGRTLRFKIFDPDTPGTSGPIIFYLDSIPREDWSICFPSSAMVNDCAGQALYIGTVAPIPTNNGWVTGNIPLPSPENSPVTIGAEGAVLYAEWYFGATDTFVQGLEWIHPQPTATPTLEPTSAPTDPPSATPTSAPTDTPTASPSAVPTDTPTSTPTTVPTDTPTPTPPPTSTPASAPIEAVGTTTGSVIGSSTVSTSSSVPAHAGQLYLAAVASKPSRSIREVTGLGLTWVRIAAQCSGRSQTRVEVWQGTGRATVDAPISATFTTTPESAVIAVTRYLNVSSVQPIGLISGKNTIGLNDATCTGGLDSRLYFLDLEAHAGSVIYSAFAMRSQTHTSGGLFTELAEVSSGGLSGSASALAIQHYAVPNTAAITLNGSASASTDWSLLAIELLPQTSLPTNPTLEPTATSACPASVPSGVTARKHIMQSDPRTLLLEWEDISAACEAVQSYKVYVWRGTYRQEWAFNRADITCNGFYCRATITFDPSQTQIYWRITATNALGEGASDNTKSYAVP